MLARCLEQSMSSEAALPRYDAAPRRANDEDRAGLGGECQTIPQSDAGGSGGRAAYVDREWHEDRVSRGYDWLFEYSAARAVV